MFPSLRLLVIGAVCGGWLLMSGAGAAENGLADQSGLSRQSDPSRQSGPSDQSHGSESVSGVTRKPVFTAGEQEYHTFRIPSLLATPKGTLLAFCEGRRHSGGDTGDIDLVLRRSTDGGETWGDLQVVWDEAGNTCGNPCPVVDGKTGRICLLMTHNLGQDNESEIKKKTGEGSRTVWITFSDDEGANWSQPAEITQDTKRADWQWYATGPGIGIQIQNGPDSGRLVIPCDHSYRDANGTRQDIQSEYGSHVIYSDDGGRHWQLGGAVTPKMNECQVVELADPEGTLLLNLRSYRGHGCRAESKSADGGETWSEPVDVPRLVEPVCQASLLRHTWPDEDGHGGLLLFSNPASAKSRTNLTVRGSGDDAQTWNKGLTLHAGPAAYSCLAKLPNGEAACLYECGRKSAYETITFARFPAELVRSQPAAESASGKP